MNTNETLKITDLEAVNAEEIKGGPRLTIKKLGSGLTEEALSDLQPTGDVIGAATKAGQGTLVLANANTYTGKTTVNNGGILQLQNGIGGQLESMNTNETIEIADLEASNADAVKGGNVSNNNRYMGTLTLNQSVLPSTAGPGGNGHIKVIDGTRFG